MKYLDYTGLPIVWTKIGSNPFTSSYGGAFSDGPMACIVNGKFSLFYACATYSNPLHYAGAVLYSWDEAGNRCEYHTAAFVNNGFFETLTPGTAIFQSGNFFTFSYNDGTAWQMVIPPIFVAGGVFTLPDGKLAINPPCGVGQNLFQRALFFSQQGLTGYEYIQGFAESDNYWASIYDSTNNFVGGGFLGNSPNDLFDRITTTLPPYTYPTDLYYKNGFNFYSNQGNAGGPYQNVGFNQPYLRGDYTSLVCGGGGNLSVYADAINQFQAFPARDWGCPGFTYSSQSIERCITDKYGFFLMVDQNLYIISKDYMVGLHTPDPVGCFGYLSKTNKLYWQYDTSGRGHYAGDIYIASFPNINIEPLPIVTRAAYNGLANYHRPVSPDGIFRA